MLTTMHCSFYNEMSRKAAELIVKEISSAKKQFSLAIPGGRSVQGLLTELSMLKMSWASVNVFMTDERLLPLTEHESNYWQAKELFFSKANSVHAFPFEMEKGIAEYNRKFLSVTGGKLDLLVLGVGEDGHVASLFPGDEVMNTDANAYVEIHDAPKGPSERISLSPKAIVEGKAVLLLFASDSKKKAYDKFLDEKVSVAECPAKIALKAQRVFVLTVFGGKNAE